MSRVLINAAGRGDLKRVEELIEMGVDVNYEYADRIALMEAALEGHLEVIKKLES